VGVVAERVADGEVAVPSRCAHMFGDRVTEFGHGLWQRSGGEGVELHTPEDQVGLRDVAAEDAELAELLFGLIVVVFLDLVRCQRWAIFDRRPTPDEGCQGGEGAGEGQGPGFQVSHDARAYARSLASGSPMGHPDAVGETRRRGRCR